MERAAPGRRAAKAQPAPARAQRRAPRLALGALARLIEPCLVVLWAAWVGRVYLNLDPNLWPRTFGFGGSVAPHYIWTLATRCGSCVLWDGHMAGGMPAFADVFGASLHPLVILTTLVWGPINGAKILIVASLAMAGLAQWWLARVLGLGWLARLWSAALAVAGGHLAGRMNVGLFLLVFSTASASLAIAAGLQLALTGERRAAVGLAVTLALALLSGQGYLQVGLLLGVLPAFLVFLFSGRLRPRPLWKELALALGLAVLLAGVLWVPLAHFYPNFAKDVETGYKYMQPLEYAPLNLVIRDLSFYARSDALLKSAGAVWHYATYIGWVPVLLGGLALRLVPRERSRLLAFFLVATGLVYLAGGTWTFRLLARVAPRFVYAMRNGSVICGLAVPLILALAAWGLDEVLKRNWPSLSLTFGEPARPSLSLSLKLSWLVLLVPLAWSVQSAYSFGQAWMKMDPPRSRDDYAQAMATESAQWVSPIWGDWTQVPLALEADQKVSQVLAYAYWKGRQQPPAYVTATRDKVDAARPDLVKTVAGVNLVVHPENEYAFVQSGTQVTPCRARALGGNVDVDCDAPAAGTLVVRENSWTGWTVTRDGQPASLGPGPWLTTEAPAGQHHYGFRYRPWDVPVGLAVTLVGVAVAAWLWLTSPHRR